MHACIPQGVRASMAKCGAFAAVVSFGLAADSCEASGQTSLEHDVLDHATSWKSTKTQVCSGATVTVIENFLPPAVAAAWRDTLNTTWGQAAPCREHGKCDNAAAGECTWLYTTNSHGGNAKIRSVHQRAERRAFVQQMYKRGGFAYSKWELTASHALYRDIGELMASESVRTTVARALGLTAEVASGRPALGNISDYFVTAYDDGDFLSTHSDGASGSLAWVLHLAGGDGWDSDNGGQLRFNAGSAVRGNRDFVPGHNRLLLFQTRPYFVPHQVLPVKAVREPRFGATGWWMTRGDAFSAATAKENAAMKAASSKAAQGDVCL